MNNDAMELGPSPSSPLSPSPIPVSRVSSFSLGGPVAANLSVGLGDEIISNLSSTMSEEEMKARFSSLCTEGFLQGCAQSIQTAHNIIILFVSSTLEHFPFAETTRFCLPHPGPGSAVEKGDGKEEEGDGGHEHHDHSKNTFHLLPSLFCRLIAKFAENGILKDLKIEPDFPLYFATKLLSLSHYASSAGEREREREREMKVHPLFSVVRVLEMGYLRFQKQGGQEFLNIFENALSYHNSVKDLILVSKDPRIDDATKKIAAENFPRFFKIEETLKLRALIYLKRIHARRLASSFLVFHILQNCPTPQLEKWLASTIVHWHPESLPSFLLPLSTLKSIGEYLLHPHTLSSPSLDANPSLASSLPRVPSVVVVGGVENHNHFSDEGIFLQAILNMILDSCLEKVIPPEVLQWIFDGMCKLMRLSICVLERHIMNLPSSAGPSPAFLWTVPIFEKFLKISSAAESAAKIIFDVLANDEKFKYFHRALFSPEVPSNQSKTVSLWRQITSLHLSATDLSDSEILEKVLIMLYLPRVVSLGLNPSQSLRVNFSDFESSHSSPPSDLPAATVEECVLRLADSHPMTSNYKIEFFLSYRSFLAPHKLLELLVSAYCQFASGRNDPPTPDLTIDSIFALRQTATDERKKRGDDGAPTVPTNSFTSESLTSTSSDSLSPPSSFSISPSTSTLIEGSPTPAGEIKTYKSEALRIANSLKFWIDTHPIDFSDDMLAVLLLSIHIIESYNEKIGKMLKSSASKLLRRGLIAYANTDPTLTRDGLPPPPFPLMPLLNTKEKWTDGLAFMFWPAGEIARQLSLNDSEFFISIQIHEFLDLGWSKKDKEKRAPNILKMINSFNRTSMWAATAVLSAEKLPERRLVLTKLIEVASECEKLNNLNGVMAVMAGLANSAVHRLRTTWGELSQETIEIHTKIEELIDPNKSYKNLRDRVGALTPPCVPYLGMYLTDLTFMSDGNPTMTPEGLVNLKKSSLIAGVLRKVQLYQQVPYNLRKLPLLSQDLLSADAWPEDKLYEISLKYEPRK